MNIKDVATFGQTYTQDLTRVSVIIDAGQSNSYTCGLPSEWPSDTLDAGIDISDGRVFQLDNSTASATYGQIITADEPLKHPVPAVGAIGSGLAYALEMATPKTIIIPYGVSNTGFFGNRWNPSDDLFMGLCSAYGVVKAKYPNASLRQMFWTQGEREAAEGWTKAQYTTAFGTFAEGLRNELEEDFAIIVSSMRPGWVAANAIRQPVQDALEEMPSRVFRVGYADASSPTVIGGTGTGVHYSASEARLMAERRRTAAQGL